MDYLKKIFFFPLVNIVDQKSSEDYFEEEWKQRYIPLYPS